MDRLGLRVPPALALDIAVAEEFARTRTLPAALRSELSDGLQQLSAVTGLTFGGPKPLIVSVRSSSGVSMPGMLEIVLDVGLTETTISGLIRRTGDPWLAWDAYRRLVRGLAPAVLGLPAALFDEVQTSHLARAGVRSLEQLDALVMRDLARASARLLKKAPLRIRFDHPMDQLLHSVTAVMASWWGLRASEYRDLHRISDAAGTGVLIQAMVFGNAGGRSGSGVAFTRNPSTGQNQLYFDTEAVCGTARLRPGDVVTVDGESGVLYAGAVPAATLRPLDALRAVNEWRAARQPQPVT